MNEAACWWKTVLAMGPLVDSRLPGLSFCPEYGNETVARGPRSN